MLTFNGEVLDINGQGGYYNDNLEEEYWAQYNSDEEDRRKDYLENYATEDFGCYNDELPL